jgi:hypothetical protein
MESNPLDPVASEPQSHAGQVFTSDLSINEFALPHGAGFEPIELVMGVSVYHVGYQFHRHQATIGAGRPHRCDQPPPADASRSKQSTNDETHH